MRKSLFSLVVVLSACGTVAPIDAGVDSGVDAGAQCDAAGRTCESAFGNFTLHTVPPAGCTPFGSQSDIPVTFGLFDGGVGPVSVGANTAPGTRVGCATLVPTSLLGSAGPVELTYEPGCQTLSGTLLHCCRFADAGSGDCALVGGK